jgi:hypothetical protein
VRLGFDRRPHARGAQRFRKEQACVEALAQSVEHAARIR